VQRLTFDCVTRDSCLGSASAGPIMLAGTGMLETHALQCMLVWMR
jgi:hypothetical protein